MYGLCLRTSEAAMESLTWSWLADSTAEIGMTTSSVIISFSPAINRPTSEVSSLTTSSLGSNPSSSTRTHASVPAFRPSLSTTSAPRRNSESSGTDRLCVSPRIARPALGLDQRQELGLEVVLHVRPVPDGPLRRLAVLEDDHGRDRHDPELHRRRRVLVDVHLHDLDLVSHLPIDLLDDRRDHAARAAPRRPEVDQHRLV